MTQTTASSRSDANPRSQGNIKIESAFHLGADPNEKQSDGHDEEWVDYEEDAGSLRSPRKVNARASSIQAKSPRKRVGKKISHSVVQKEMAPPSSKTSSRASTADEQPPTTQELIAQYGWEGAEFVAKYALSILKPAGKALRYPFIIWVFLYLLTFITGYISHSLYRAFQPICVIPGFGFLPVCRPWGLASSQPGDGTPKWADYSTLMAVQSKSFEQLLEDSVGGSSLSLEIKKAEMATTDLVARVRISDLKAKDSLATSLNDFVNDAKNTGRGLQKLTSKVGGAVDNIMSVNDYALRSIESARENEPSKWSLQRIWQPPAQSVDAVVRRTFDEAMNVLSKNMARLILEAENNLHNLNNLEERLVTLHETVAREDSSILSAKSDLLAQLWTQLGGNRRHLKNFDNHLELLKGLTTYRKEAQVHVVAALQTLRAMSDDMEDLRERVAAPDLIGETIPVEVHMKSIQMGLDRLREGRIRAKKLEEAATRKVLSVGGSDDDDE